jgi:two-component system, OmpR family, alkaline phosphatase synthesis response regulator PhoP
MPKRILVVEDDPEMVDLLSFGLKRAGFLVATALDGIEGLKKAKSILPDLILLDLMLPEMDGYGVCETLRRDSALVHVPIIMLTALSSQFAQIHGLEVGATDFVSKPFVLKDLIRKIDHALGGRPEPVSPSRS